MAKVKLSAFIADIRGAVAGSVFGKGLGGNSIRSASMPVYRQSSAMGVRRSASSSVSREWRTLSVSTQVAWNAAASSWFWRDAFGRAVPYTGFELYRRLNTLRRSFGQSLLSLPPAQPTFPACYSIVGNCYVGSASLTFTTVGSSSFGGGNAFFYCTRSLSQGITKVKQKYALTGTGNFNATTANTYSTYVSRLGTPIVGSKIFVMMKLWHTASGVFSAPFYGSFTVQA